MNLKSIHLKEKAVSAVPFFKGEEGSVIALQLLNNQELKSHTTKVPALLICIEGNVNFKNELDVEQILLPGDYVNIEAGIKHWVIAKLDSQLLLLK